MARSNRDDAFREHGDFQRAELPAAVDETQLPRRDSGRVREFHSTAAGQAPPAANQLAHGHMRRRVPALGRPDISVVLSAPTTPFLLRTDDTPQGPVDSDTAEAVRALMRLDIGAFVEPPHPPTGSGGPAEESSRVP